MGKEEEEATRARTHTHTLPHLFYVFFPFRLVSAFVGHSIPTMVSGEFVSEAAYKSARTSTDRNANSHSRESFIIGEGEIASAK